MDEELASQISQGQKLLEKVAKLRRQIETERHSNVIDLQDLRDEFHIWDEYNQLLLRSRFSTGEGGYTCIAIYIYIDTDKQNLARTERFILGQLWKLESIRQQLSSYNPVEISTTRRNSMNPHIGDTIFIVHGHDGDTKQQVAGFVERITGERPVILHEKADSGRTVIEKFEEYAGEVGFAIILLTADDEGQKKGAASLNLRARQNVVFEFGYFMAKLGRSRVVALHEADVELPSDVAGILYKSLAGNWKFELAREIQAAGIDVDLGKALR
jgi:predicted nucleotide-binding protein